jgi:hypothetical protein
MNELSAFENEVRKILGLSAVAEEEPEAETPAQKQPLSEVELTAEFCEKHVSDLKRLIKKHYKPEVVAFEEGLKKYMESQKAKSTATVQFNF